MTDAPIHNTSLTLRMHSRLLVRVVTLCVALCAALVEAGAGFVGSGVPALGCGGRGKLSQYIAAHCRKRGGCCHGGECHLFGCEEWLLSSIRKDAKAHVATAAVASSAGGAGASADARLAAVPSRSAEAEPFHANGVAPLKRQEPSLTPVDLVRVYQDVTVQGMADEEAADADAVEAHLFGPPPRLRKRHTVPVQTQTIDGGGV
jgi:hypothetical protein